MSCGAESYTERGGNRPSSPSFYVTHVMSVRKRILLISSNALFTEVLAQSISGYSGLELILATPTFAVEEIKTFPPDVIIVDEAVGSNELGHILIAARELACAQILLMNLKGNEFVILDSHKVMIQQAGDLLKTVLGDWDATDKKGG
jgi:hypothetical protein